MKIPYQCSLTGYSKAFFRKLTLHSAQFLPAFITFSIIPVFLSPGMAMEQASSFFEKEYEKPHEEFLGFRISKSFLTPALQPRTLPFERLEFLGDRVLGMTVAQFLYGKYPSAEVPELARIFESVVSNDSLAGMYEILNINASRLVSANYCTPTQGLISQKTCSDIVEAFMGAVYQQGGFQEACAFGEKLLGEHYEFEENKPTQRPGYSSLSRSNHPASQKIAPLQDKISYRFQNIHLLQEAFCHTSMGGTFYKKLDFLGVRILALVVAEELYGSYPNYGEGLLTGKFISIVNNESLVDIFEAWRLGNYLIRQSGDFSSSVPPRIAANTVRALIGAVYLDHKDWPSARSVCRLLLSFKAIEERFEKLTLRVMPPDNGLSLEKEPLGIALKMRRTNHFNNVPLDIAQKVFRYIQDPDAANSQKTRFRKCSPLSLVSKQWRGIFIDVYQTNVPYYYAWAIQGATLDEIKQQVYRTPDEEGGYLNEWFWEGPWPLFENYFVLPNMREGFSKLPVPHLSRLTIQDDFNPDTQGSLAFLRCLLPQVKLGSLCFKGLKDKDCHFMEILFEDHQASSKLQELFLEGLDLSKDSLLALLPLLHCERLTLVNPLGQPPEGIFEKALLSAHNLGALRIRDTRSVKNTRFAETVLNISMEHTDIPRIMFNAGLAMVMGRNYFQNDDPSHAERCFRMAIESGIPEASHWLAELFLIKFTPSRREEARILYQSIAQDMDDDLCAAFASARLADLFAAEDESIKDIIAKSYGRWSAFMPDDPPYNQALLDYCWVMENFSRKKGSGNFAIIDWLQNRKYIEGSPPLRGGFIRGNREKEEESNNKSLGYLNDEVKKLYKILADRGFLKGIMGLHKFYLREGDLKKAEKCLKESIKKDDPHIMLALGRFYETNGQNIEMVRRLYQRASNVKNAYAKIWVGNNTLAETGNIALGLRLYKQAAFSGNPYAAYVLYTTYQNGFILDRRYPLSPEERVNLTEKTSYWFRRSHEFGNPWIMKNHLNTFKDKQDFDGGILYLQKYENPFMKKSEYFNNVGYFHMKKYEISKTEEHFDEAKKSFEAATKTASAGSFSYYGRTFESTNASLNLGWLYYTHALHNPLTRANDLQNANSNMSHAWYYSGGLPELTEEEKKRFKENIDNNWGKIKEAARRFNIKLQSIAYD